MFILTLRSPGVLPGRQRMWHAGFAALLMVLGAGPALADLGFSEHAIGHRYAAAERDLAAEEGQEAVSRRYTSKDFDEIEVAYVDGIAQAIGYSVADADQGFSDAQLLAMFQRNGGLLSFRGVRQEADREYYIDKLGARLVIVRNNSAGGPSSVLFMSRAYYEDVLYSRGVRFPGIEPFMGHHAEAAEPETQDSH